MKLVVTALAAMLVAICPAAAQTPAARDSVADISESHLFAAIAALAADSMEGRKAGTPGGDRARAFLVKKLTSMGVGPLVPSYTTQFNARSQFNEKSPVPYGEGRPANGIRVANYRVYGTNVLGVVRGTEHPSRYIVVSAHYDHLGTFDGRIWNGADDNASGSAGILAIAEWTVTHPPKSSIIFAWFDGEEEGLLGSQAFVDKPPVPRDSIIADLNLDMISRSVTGELFAVGLRAWPVMGPLVDSVAALGLVKIVRGHDEPGPDDLTNRSDQGPFNDRKIPFVFFGVAEHADYHRTTDRVERIQPEFYLNSVVTAAELLRRLDASLDAIAVVRHRR